MTGHPAQVEWRDGAIVRVRWRDERDRPRVAHVAQAIDEWLYVGRWWEGEVRRDYRLLETREGRWLEMYASGEAWWVASTSG
jgi:hypothetical protein